MPRSRKPSSSTSRRIRIRVRRAGRERSRFGWFLDTLLIGMGLGVTFLMAGGITLLLVSRTADPLVPDLEGLDPARAERILAGVGLRLAEIGSEFHDRTPVGRIARQDPDAGVAFKRGRSVRVYLSLGPTRAMVPRLEGENLIEARRRLESEGFRMGRVSEIPNDSYIAGRVIAQSPTAYAERVPGDPVSVLVSAGAEPESFLMPDFIGRPYGDLADALSRAAVRVGEVRSVDYPEVPQGTVVDQSPRAGLRVTQADRIVLVLSR